MLMAAPLLVLYALSIGVAYLVARPAPADDAEVASAEPE
jgi:Sec-independent protein secretion pathway component TatC